MVTNAIITVLIKLLLPVFVNIHHRAEEKPTPTPQTSSPSPQANIPLLSNSAPTTDSGSASTPSSSPAANPSADKRNPQKLTWDQDTATKLQQFKLCPLFPKTQPTCRVSRSAEGRVLAQRVERSRSFRPLVRNFLVICLSLLNTKVSAETKKLAHISHSSDALVYP